MADPVGTNAPQGASLGHFATTTSGDRRDRRQASSLAALSGLLVRPASTRCYRSPSQSLQSRPLSSASEHDPSGRQSMLKIVVAPLPSPAPKICKPYRNFYRPKRLTGAFATQKGASAIRCFGLAGIIHAPDNVYFGWKADFRDDAPDASRKRAPLV